MLAKPKVWLPVSKRARQKFVMERLNLKRSSTVSR